MRAVLGILVVLIIQAAALAQFNAPIGVPPDQYRGELRHGPNTIRFCVDTRNPEWQVNRDIAQAVGEALLLNVEFFEFGYDYAPSAAQFVGIPENLLFIFLGDECEAFIGTRMSPFSKFPDWVITSRPYLATGYVLAYRSDAPVDPAQVLDRPDGPKVGIPVVSPMESAIGYYFPRTHRRIYPSEDAALEGLLQGEVDAALLYELRLYALTAGDPGAAGISTTVLSGVPAVEWEIGMSLNEDRAFTRNMIDSAIAALAADGTIDRILAEYGYSGSALTRAAQP